MNSLLRLRLPVVSLGIAFSMGPAASAWADLRATEEAQITGNAGVGTTAPRARLDVRMGAGDDYALKVSSQNGAYVFGVDKAGKVGVGVSAPEAWVDVQGSADNGDIGLQLRVGNSTSTNSSSQIAFGNRSTETYRHSIRTRHAAGQDLGNAIDFYLSRTTGQPTALGSYLVLSLEAIPTASSGAVHTFPFGTADVEFEVSNGTGTGQGIIHRFQSLTPSSLAGKREIEYLELEDERQAYEDVRSLRHVLFRFKGEGPEQPLRRGLIFEEVPLSIRGEGKTVVINGRVLIVELAVKEAYRLVEELEAQVAALERELGVDGGR